MKDVRDTGLTPGDLFVPFITVAQLKRLPTGSSTGIWCYVGKGSNWKCLFLLSREGDHGGRQSETLYESYVWGVLL